MHIFANPVTNMHLVFSLPSRGKVLTANMYQRYFIVMYCLLTAVPDQLMLCKVDIYGTSTFWPKPSLMKVVHSEDDESCNAACTRHHLVITN